MNRIEMLSEKEEIDYTAVGKRIRACRKSKKMTQAQMGKAVGLSMTFIGHIERGSRIPSVDTLFHIAKALGVSTDELLTGLPSHMEASIDRTLRMRILKNMVRVLDDHAPEWLGEE